MSDATNTSDAHKLSDEELGNVTGGSVWSLSKENRVMNSYNDFLAKNPGTTESIEDWLRSNRYYDDDILARRAFIADGSPYGKNYKCIKGVVTVQNIPSIFL